LMVLHAVEVYTIVMTCIDTNTLTGHFIRVTQGPSTMRDRPAASSSSSRPS